MLFLVLVVGLLSGWPAPAAQPRAGAARSVRLQLKWHHQFQFAGYYAAQAQGYYRQEGLEVTILEGDAQHPSIREVLAGRANFGVSDADVLKGYLEGKPLVVLAAIFQHSPYILLSRADSGLRTPSDLRGKTIMLSDEQGLAQLKALFRREGMSLQEVHIVPHQWNNELLIRRQVDAISAYSTVEPFQLQAHGVEPAMIRAMDYGVDFYGDTLFTTQEEVREHPATVAAFRRASLRGWEYAMAHPEEMINRILRLPGVRERGVSREMLRYEAEAMRDLVLPGLVDIGHMNPGRWQAMARTYADIGVIGRVPSERQLEAFIYRPAPPGHEEWVVPLLVSLGALGLVAFGVFVWNLQLRRSVARRTAALQRAEQQLDFHVENSPLAVIEWDGDVRVVRWTGQAEEVFGWKLEEVLGKHPSQWRFIHEEDREVVERVMTRLRSGQEPRNFCSNRNYRKDGTVVDCEWYNSASSDKQGQIRSILSLVLDVTGRKQAEEALREREEWERRRRGELTRAMQGRDEVVAQLNALLANAPLGFAFFDREHRYVRINEFQARQINGLPVEAHLGRPIREVLPVIARAVDPLLDLVFNSGAPVENVVVTGETLVTPGERRHWLTGWFPVRTPDGKIPWAGAVVMDITAQRLTQAALQRQNQRLQLLQRAAAELLLAREPVAILQELHSRLAADFSTDVFLLYVASEEGRPFRLQASGGLNAEEERRLEQLKFGRAVCTKPAEAREPIIATQIQTVEGPNRRFVRKLGFQAYLCYPLVVEERLLGTLAFASRRRETYDPADLEFFQSIARTLAEALERQRLGSELHRHATRLEELVQERTAKLRETVQELEGLSYSLVHDMRAPLRAMQAYASALAEESGSQLQPESREYLRRIKLAAARMDQLITDSLNYSTVLREELPLGPVDVGKLLRGLVETYPNLQAPGAAIRIEFDHLLVHGNAAALTQVFSNLLGNAVKFVAPGVRPQIRVWAQDLAKATGLPPLGAESRRKHQDSGPPKVLIWVEDNGIGIPREAHQKIFGMFHRMHRAEEYPGTGIGLAIVRKSLERIGGQVCLDSEPGKGSRFCVELSREVELDQSGAMAA